MTTTREVEAARAERRRRAAEAAHTAERQPRTAAERAAARAAAAHAAATARNAWRCPLGCHRPDEWQPAATKADAFRAADAHYDTRHAT